MIDQGRLADRILRRSEMTLSARSAEWVFAASSMPLQTLRIILRLCSLTRCKVHPD